MRHSIDLLANSNLIVILTYLHNQIRRQPPTLQPICSSKVNERYLLYYLQTADLVFASLYLVEE